MKFIEYNKRIRSRIKTGDLFYTASPAIFSRLIRFFTRSKISHVGTFLWIGNRLFIAESMEGTGCRLMLASERFRKERFVLQHVKKVDNGFVDRVLDDIGRIKYDLTGALLSLFYDTKSAQKFCSEWIVKIYNLDFSHLSRGVVPADIYTLNL